MRRLTNASKFYQSFNYWEFSTNYIEIISLFSKTMGIYIKIYNVLILFYIISINIALYYSVKNYHRKSKLIRAVVFLL